MSISSREQSHIRHQILLFEDAILNVEQTIRKIHYNENLSKDEKDDLSYEIDRLNEYIDKHLKLVLKEREMYGSSCSDHFAFLHRRRQ